MAPADAGHHQERRRPARHFRGQDAGGDRRHDAAARAGLGRVAQGRPVARRHGAQRARPVVHVVVRRVGRAEPRDVQPRAPHREAAGARSAVGDHRAGRALRLHARHREHHRRRAQHGRRAARLQRHHVRLLRQVPEGRCQRPHREAGEGHLLHDGQQQVADVGRVAAGRRAADDVPPVERRPRQLAERRRPADRWRRRTPMRRMCSPTIR